jgi:hypothetical protein
MLGEDFQKLVMPLRLVFLFTYRLMIFSYLNIFLQKLHIELLAIQIHIGNRKYLTYM